MPRISLLREQQQSATRDDHVAPRRDDIHMIRREMPDDHKAHPGIVRQGAEQLLQRLQPARRSPHPTTGNVAPFPG